MCIYTALICLYIMYLLLSQNRASVCVCAQKVHMYSIADLHGREHTYLLVNLPSPLTYIGV